MKATAKWAVAAVAAGTTAGLMAAPAAQAGLSLGRLERQADYQVLEQSQDGLWCEPTVVAVQSAEAWDQAMRALAAEGVLMVLPAPAAPQLDWSEWTVVLVSLGGQSQRGAAVQVTGARVSSRNLHLDVSLKAPNGGLGGDPYMPYVLVAVERNHRVSMDKVHLHYTLETPDSYMPAGELLPTEVAVQYGTQQQTLLTWGRLKADYR